MQNAKFKNQKVGVLGLGEENLALTKYLAKQGARVVVCDQKSREELGDYYKKVKDLPVQFRLGPHYLDHLEDFKTVFRTPGLPYLTPQIMEAKKAGVEISSQTKLFFSLCPCPIIGVTGTKGKGTTTALIGEILELSSGGRKSVSGKRIYIGGNIGNPPIEFIDKLNPTDWVILELSSFQLQDLDKSPHIAVILDIKVDHLDYHKDEKEYIEAKRNLVKFQSKDDFTVINADYLTSIEFANSTQSQVWWFSRRKSVDSGAFVQYDRIILRADEQDYVIIDKKDIQLRGEHNLENICAATAASYLAGTDIKSVKKAVTEFKGLEHRLEFVRVYNGIKFYNDSFSTTPDTTIAAIKSFQEPIILLLGGSEKGADYQELADIIDSSNVKKIMSIGMTAPKIIKKIKSQKIKAINKIQSMQKAVNEAFSRANPGDVVLLSPASASFDRFKNYKQRGNLFKQFVNGLK